MPRKSGTSGSEGGRRKRTRSTGTSPAAYPTACVGSGGGRWKRTCPAGTSPASYLTFVTCSGTYGFGGAVASAVRPFAGLCMPVRQSGGGRSGVVPSEGALPGISGVSLDRSLPEQEVAPEDEPPHPGAGERRRGAPRPRADRPGGSSAAGQEPSASSRGWAPAGTSRHGLML